MLRETKNLQSQVLCSKVSAFSVPQRVEHVPNRGIKVSRCIKYRQFLQYLVTNLECRTWLLSDRDFSNMHFMIIDVDRSDFTSYKCTYHHCAYQSSHQCQYCDHLTISMTSNIHPPHSPKIIIAAVAYILLGAHRWGPARVINHRFVAPHDQRYPKIQVSLSGASPRSLELLVQTHGDWIRAVDGLYCVTCHPCRVIFSSLGLNNLAISLWLYLRFHHTVVNFLGHFMPFEHFCTLFYCYMEDGWSLGTPNFRTSPWHVWKNTHVGEAGHPLPPAQLKRFNCSPASKGFTKLQNSDNFLWDKKAVPARKVSRGRNKMQHFVWLIMAMALS